MAENLDDDEPAPEPDQRFEDAAPAPLTKSRPNPVSENSGQPAAGADVDYEYALCSAILGPDGAKFWAQAEKALAGNILQMEPRQMWAAWQDGTPLDDLITLAEKTKISIARILEIGRIDTMGVTWASGLRILLELARAAEIKHLAGRLVERPDLADTLGPKLVALTAASAPIKGPAGVPATDFRIMPASDRSCLLGNRYLNRGDGMVIAGNSGMGKSSLTIQSAIMWGLGKDFMGIKPNGLLKSLILQSEDSEGDIAEVVQSIFHHLKFGPEEIETVRRNVILVTDRINRGAAFIKHMASLVKLHKPDLVWINPLAAFADGDMAEAQEAGIFLREQLNGLNSECEFAYVIVTHTTKPATGKDKGERKWNEAQYNMAGSYDLTGWARAIICVEATEIQGEFNLTLAKRGVRAGIMKSVVGENGIERLERSTSIPVKHATGFFRPAPLTEDIPLVVWEKRTVATSQEEGKRPGGPTKVGFDNYALIFPNSKEKAKGVRVLHRLANEIRPLSISTFMRLVDDAVKDQFLVRCLDNPLQPTYYFKTTPKE